LKWYLYVKIIEFVVHIYPQFYHIRLESITLQLKLARNVVKNVTAQALALPFAIT